MSVTVVAGASPGEIVVRDGDRVQRMYAIVAAGVTWVFQDGNVYRLEDETATRRAHQTHGSLSSPMPATVISVNVAPGDQVTAGQTLIVLEAMKMELPVRAATSGIVTKVNCAEGAMVQPGEPLVEIDPAEPAA